MPHLVRWHDELSAFGLVIVGPHVSGGDDEKVKSKAQSLGVNFAVVKSGSVKDADFSGIPHCMLFDHTGKCLFRGSPTAVETQLRNAVGKSLADSLTSAQSKAVAPLLEALKKGQPPMAVLQRAVPLQKATDTSTASDAKLLVSTLTASAQKKVEAAESQMKDDPLGAYNRLERVPLDFKGTPVATKANDLLTNLKKDKTVAAELKARPSLDSIKKLDTLLSQQAQASKVDPKDPNFLRVAAPVLTKMRGTLQQMKKSFPESKATEEASVIAEKYGVTIR